MAFAMKLDSWEPDARRRRSALVGLRPSSIDVDEEVRMAEIKVHRRSGGYQDRLRAYRVMLDGKKVGSVVHGEVLAVSTTPGHHELYVALDWCRSKRLGVDLAENDVVDLACWPNANPITAIFYGTIGRSRYIGLQLLDTSDAEPGP